MKKYTEGFDDGFEMGLALALDVFERGQEAVEIEVAKMPKIESLWRYNMERPVYTAVLIARKKGDRNEKTN